MTPVDRIHAAIHSGRLVVVAGTGVSLALTQGSSAQLSWRGLIEHGFQYAFERGLITEEQVKAWKPQLMSSDLDDFLGAAEYAGRKLGAPNGDLYARWLEEAFHGQKVTSAAMREALKAIEASNAPIATLNYDLLIEEALGTDAILLSDVRLGEWMRREARGILHLNGSWRSPASCVVGIRDYHASTQDERRSLIEKSLGSFNLLLFVGCGNTFADPNFSILVEWLRSKMGARAPLHYALVTEDELAVRRTDKTWQGFVEPLAFGKTFDKLPIFLRSLFERHGAHSTPALTSALPATTRSSASAVIARYRRFVVRDCGQMTIEGVRADMDTAKQKFDLERLFVPLKVMPPPDLSMNDLDQESAIRERKARLPIPFGELLAQEKRIALLALPGGGKTLLLKRLAVAYADPVRLAKSGDALPSIKLTPLIIRCREWREQITKPLPTIIDSIAAFTGQPDLEGLFAALRPALEAGEVLLLIDGLDEIHDDAHRVTFVENLERFLDEYKDIRLVVSSREAGFELVAPSLSRFCERWRIAPLDQHAIAALCDHWHQLMSANSAEAAEESKALAQHILHNESLRLLAENPLLLTMLLVVKHGAGRLPPDRVSLYQRAVEILLDTWNIKGHTPLNLKEAVPQLSCVAFEMMKQGKQTVTEAEFIDILEQARESIPHIKRYSKDDPDRFLKRVELRSSLVVEGGRQRDGIELVPFYQFRHLTFQEYLAAVAATEGYYLGYVSGKSPIDALVPYLSDEKWREVMSMAIVMGKKHSEVLLSAIVAQVAASEKQIVDSGDAFYDPTRVPVVSLLISALAEEAEISPTTLPKVMRQAVQFAQGLHGHEPWEGVVAGVYGDELLQVAGERYRSFPWQDVYVPITYSRLLAMKVSSPRKREEAVAQVEESIKSSDVDTQIDGLMLLMGLSYDLDVSSNKKFLSTYRASLIDSIFNTSTLVWYPAIWLLPNVFDGRRRPDSRILNRLLEILFSEASWQGRRMAGFTLHDIASLVPRGEWKPQLGEDRRADIVKALQDPEEKSDSEFANSFERVSGGPWIIAFHLGDLVSDMRLAELARTERFNFDEDARRKLVKQLSPEAQQAYKKPTRKSNKKK